jgi:hypothetical protein
MGGPPSARAEINYITVFKPLVIKLCHRMVLVKEIESHNKSVTKKTASIKVIYVESFGRNCGHFFLDKLVRNMLSNLSFTLSVDESLSVVDLHYICGESPQRSIFFSLEREKIKISNYKPTFHGEII